MIHIQYVRRGLLILAATVNDNGHVTQSWGFTEHGAMRRLVKAVQ